MVQVQFNELARKIDKLIVKVTNGESCLVIKNGKSVRRDTSCEKPCSGLEKEIA